MPHRRDLAVASADLFTGLLRRTHLSRPDQLADVVAEEAGAALGAEDVVLSLVNHEHTALVQVPSRHAPAREEQPVDGSMAGRSFAGTRVLTADAGPDRHGRPRRRLWVPLLDGSERLGVLELTVPVGAEGQDVPGDEVAVWERYAHLVAMVTVSKSSYSDVVELVRRSKAMTVGSELIHAVLPPSTYSCEGLVLSGMLEPAYDHGGDAYDYAVNSDAVHLAIFDGMGHGLTAAGLTTFALGTYRAARRSGADLRRTYVDVNEALLQQFGGDRHVTAVLARFEADSGRLTWINAGHPPPLLLRGSQVVKALQAKPTFPLGWPFPVDPEVDLVVAEEVLQPGDAVLLYTDGLTEARRPHEDMLGVEGLAAFLTQEAAAGQAAPETLRRLRRAVLDRQQGVLRDDATALLVEWRRGSEQGTVPQTVL